MNQVATIEKPSRLDVFRQQLLPPDKKHDLLATLPSHIKPERFERNLVNVLMQNPGLMAYDPRLIFREVCKIAALGLLFDPQLGEAYLIEAWNGKTKQKEPQARVGYRGLMKLGRQSGDISMLYAHEVHAKDVFECSLGTEKVLRHKPDPFGDRGQVVGYYAVVKYTSGAFDFEPMSVAEAHRIRDRSDGWKAFQAGKIKSTPWSTDEEEMSKKTAIRRLCKRLPQSPELSEALAIEDTAEFRELRDVSPAPEALIPPSPPPPPADEPVAEAADEVAGADETENPAPPAPKSAPKASAPHQMPPRRRTAKAPEPAKMERQADAEEAETVDPETGEVSEPIDPDAYLDELESTFASCETLDDLNDAWAVHEGREADMFPPDRDRAQAAYERHEGRLSG